MTFRSCFTMLGLSCLALPHSLLASVSYQSPIKIHSQSAVMVDEETNEVRLTLRGRMLLDGDMDFSLYLYPRMRALPSNADISTRATQIGLSASSSIKQSFSAHFPDDGHFGLDVEYRFHPDGTVSDDPPVSTWDAIPIYVTMAGGEIARVDHFPDPAYVHPEEVVMRPPSRAPRASGASEPITITVNLSGRVIYRFLDDTFSSDPLVYPVPSVGLRVDWDPSTYSVIDQPTDNLVGRLTAVTNDDGYYNFNFSFASDIPAEQIASQVRIIAYTHNDAVSTAGVRIRVEERDQNGIIQEDENGDTIYTTIQGPAIFTDELRVDVDGNELSGTLPDLEVDRHNGSIVRNLYRAYQFTIAEFGYTPAQVGYIYNRYIGHVLWTDSHPLQ